MWKKRCDLASLFFTPTYNRGGHLKLACFRAENSFPIEERAALSHGGIKHVASGVVDHANGGGCTIAQRYADHVLRQALDEFARPINGVDNPGLLARKALLIVDGFLGKPAVVWTSGAEAFVQ